MTNWLLVGVWRHVLRLPPGVGERRVGQLAERARAVVGKLPAEHRQVHRFVATELPRLGEPIPPRTVAERLDLPEATVGQILADLEERKGFLVRNPEGSVVWVYPTTVEPTPHRVRFKSGETLYAA